MGVNWTGVRGCMPGCTIQQILDGLSTSRLVCALHKQFVHGMNSSLQLYGNHISGALVDAGVYMCGCACVSARTPKLLPSGQ